MGITITFHYQFFAAFALAAFSAFLALSFSFALIGAEAADAANGMVCSVSLASELLAACVSSSS
eukprot:SAG31_NODE_22645_length_520_cov_110.767221_1_plen_63_part_10